MSLMTVASALAQLLQSADCSQDDQERLIEETDGFILSRDVTSSIDVPPFSNSAMDGYAVRAVDVAVGQKLSVGQIIAAGARGLRIKQVARVGFSLARLCRLVQIRC